MVTRGSLIKKTEVKLQIIHLYFAFLQPKTRGSSSSVPSAEAAAITASSSTLSFGEDQHEVVAAAGQQPQPIALRTRKSSSFTAAMVTSVEAGLLTPSHDPKTLITVGRRGMAFSKTKDAAGAEGDEGPWSPAHSSEALTPAITPEPLLAGAVPHYLRSRSSTVQKGNLQSSSSFAAAAITPVSITRAHTELARGHPTPGLLHSPPSSICSLSPSASPYIPRLTRAASSVSSVSTSSVSSTSSVLSAPVRRKPKSRRVTAVVPKAIDIIEITDSEADADQENDPDDIVIRTRPSRRSGVTFSAGAAIITASVATTTTVERASKRKRSERRSSRQRSVSREPRSDDSEGRVLRNTKARAARSSSFSDSAHSDTDVSDTGSEPEEVKDEAEDNEREEEEEGAPMYDDSDDDNMSISDFASSPPLKRVRVEEEMEEEIWFARERRSHRRSSSVQRYSSPAPSSDSEWGQDDSDVEDSAESRRVTRHNIDESLGLPRPKLCNPQHPFNKSLYPEQDTQRAHFDAIEREVWGWTLEREKTYLPSPHYFHDLAEFPQSFRNILVDWIFEVSQEFRLHRETTHLSLNYLDRYLSTVTTIKRKELQLLGVTALFVAAKLEEIYPPNVRDFSAVTDGLFTYQDLHVTELKILDAIKWKMVPPTLNYWVNFYLQNSTRVTGPECDEEVARTTHDLKHFFGPKFMVDKYARVMSLVDVAVHDFKSLEFPYSLLAASATSLILDDEQHKNLVFKSSGFSLQQTEECRTWLIKYLEYPGVNVSVTKPAKASPTDWFNLQHHNDKLLSLLNSKKR